MSIGKKVEEAIAKMDVGDHEEALSQISIAIDATAKLEASKGGRESYKQFIHKNLGLITAVAFEDKSILNLHLAYQHPDIELDEKGLCTIQEVMYHAVRCGLMHESKLPANLRFTDDGQIRVDAGEVVLPSSLIYGLITVVVLSPLNADERVSGNPICNYGGVPLLVNCLWGRRAEFEWLHSARKHTIAFLSKQKAQGTHGNSCQGAEI